MANSKKLIVGNWKMYGALEKTQALLADLKAQSAHFPASAEVVVCPPDIVLPIVAWALAKTPIKLGAQDCSDQPEGAFTGDVSVRMIKEAGASYVIVGHSERRTIHRETNEDVRKKAAASMKEGLIPIICIGETASEREAGKAQAVVETQVKESLPNEARQSRFILAYEPVWAIGSGKTPSADDIMQMHTYIASVAAERTGLAKEAISVLYGGSVKAANAKEILHTQSVAGVLVGGASLKADEFNKIIAAAV
jgi:triosephosphate isomerase (TIM)